ncbi:MAG: YdcF family protein [Rhizobiaceae bacterium]
MLRRGTIGRNPDRGNGLIESILPKTGNREKPVRSKGFGGLLASLRIFTYISAAVILSLTVGFLYFASEIDRLAAVTDITEADGIVVLTGDGDRIYTGLELLRQGKGERLLISGVHEKTSKTILQKITGARADLFDCCVDIDRAALDTVGNAKQASSWVERNGFDRIILVTSDYHMPRSMIEFSRRLGDAEIIPFAVTGEAEQQDNAPWTERRWQLVSGEFFKYIVSRMRLGVREKQNRSAFASTFSL